MLKLKSQNLHYLSDNVLKILAQNRIVTIFDFLEEDITKLTSLTKLNLSEILAIRNEIFGKYSAVLVNGKSLLKKVSNNCRCLPTGIKSLDAATCGGIPIGPITEICGIAQSGKTQLAFQLAINCVNNAECTVLYIDTKGDFSAIRVQKILEAQKRSHKEMAEIMYKIKVVHIWSMEELVDLFKSIKNKTLPVENLSLVIVDSLPCLMFQYLGDENKIGLSLLNTLVNYSRFIGSECNIGVIYINIQTRWIDSDVNEVEDDGESFAGCKESTYVEKRNRCLGKYWELVPVLILALETIEDFKESHDSAQIRIFVLSPSNIKCHKNECILTLNGGGLQ